MPSLNDRSSGISVTSQYDWMVQVYDPAVHGKPGGWSDYWSVSTWTRNRRAALKKASEMMTRVKHRFRWRLPSAPTGERHFEPMTLTIGEAVMGGLRPTKKAAS